MTRRRPRIRCLLLLATGSLSFSPAGHCAQKTRNKTYGDVRGDRALVYFLRVPSWGKGVENELYLYSGEEFLGVLHKNSYTFAYLAPGTHTLWNSAAVREKGSTDPSSTRDVELQAGKEYYIVMNYRIPPHVFFAVVNPDDGRALLEDVHFHVTADEGDTAVANALREERYSWLQEVSRRRRRPETVVWRMPEAERVRVLCTIHKIFVQEVEIPETGSMRTVSNAEDFQRALEKHLARRGFQVASHRAEADAVLAGVVAKTRRQTHNAYKWVSSAHVALQTLEGQEIWATDVDNAIPSITTTVFNTWSRLARRAVALLHDECAKGEP